MEPTLKAQIRALGLWYENEFSGAKGGADSTIRSHIADLYIELTDHLLEKK